MKGSYAFAALMALMAASCGGSDSSSPRGCAGTAVVIRDYLRTSQWEIDPAAVSLDTCVCHID